MMDRDAILRACHFGGLPPQLVALARDHVARGGAYGKPWTPTGHRCVLSPRAAQLVAPAWDEQLERLWEAAGGDGGPRAAMPVPRLLARVTRCQCVEPRVMRREDRGQLVEGCAACGRLTQGSPSARRGAPRWPSQGGT